MYVTDRLNNPNLWSYLVRESLKVFKEKILENRRNTNTRTGASAERELGLLEFLVQSSKLLQNTVVTMHTEFADALKLCGYDVRRVKIKAESKVLVGASAAFGKLPFEIGMNFDPFLNTPFIPGSSIKGAVRSALYDIFRKKKNNVKIEEISNRLFGEQGIMGLLGFTDAYPVEPGVNGYVLFPDVITPHYQDDTRDELHVSPIPNPFLTVAPGTVFQFYMFYRKHRGKRNLLIGDGNEFDLAENPHPDISALGAVDLGLLYAFYRGVGAKTSVGYSRFEVIEYVKV